ncbi:anti-anti sigma factor protein [Sorangium cellulosum]|uniref:Anti-anti sigma factor protein n=1 Tax=Sorangium cellulosum TaxID=56 RepID=A0A2L0F870_SORCE|nr:PAS domain-containing protein [Sorangium cellulosum]AUX47712.1 anti-anti sigma factor protein [Sorangium cellulosum]
MPSDAPVDLYSLAFTSSPDPLLLLDESGRILALNPAAERLCSAPGATARGEPVDEALRPDPPLGALLEQALRDRAPRALPPDFTVHLAGERVVLAEGSLSPLVDPAGACAAVLLALRDVTEQRRAEQAAREQGARLHAAAEALDVGFVIYDAEERLCFFNTAYKSLYPECAAAIQIGNTFEDVVREGCRKGIHLHSGLSEDEWVAARLADQRRPGEVYVRRFGDRWLTLKSSRLADGSFVGLRIDTTELKQAELALERERQFIRHVLDAIPSVVTVKDQDGKMKLVSRAYTELYDITAEGAVGKTVADLPPSHAELSAISEMDREVLARMQRVSRVQPITRPNGEVRWMSIIKVPLVEQDGTAHIVGIGTDITAQRKHDEHMAATIAELELQKQAIADQLAVIQRQQALIRALSTPILQVAEGVLAVPLIGALDDARAADVTGKLLDEVVRTGARFAIIDVTGIEGVDAATADHLVRIVRAIRLLGASGVLTGIGPAVAQSMCGLGVDLSGVTTHGNLRAGIEVCLRALPERR